MAEKIKNSQNNGLGDWCKISKLVELRDIRQISGSFEQKPQALIAKKNIVLERKASVEIDEDNKMIFVVVDFGLKANPEDDKDSTVINISASFLVAYKMEEFKTFVNKDLKCFADNNGIYNAWPFWREFVQSASVRMGLPAITLPVFRIWATK